MMAANPSPPDDEKKETKKTPSLDDEIYSFQVLVNYKLRNQEKQGITPLTENGHLVVETGLDSRKFADELKNQLKIDASKSQSARDIEIGDKLCADILDLKQQGLEGMTFRDQISRDTFAKETEELSGTYADNVTELISVFHKEKSAVLNRAKTTIDKLMTANSTSTVPDKLTAESWNAGFQATSTLAKIQEIKTELETKKAELEKTKQPNDQGIIPAPDPKIENQIKLLDNQIKKLDDFRKEVETSATNIAKSVFDTVKGTTLSTGKTIKESVIDETRLRTQASDFVFISKDGKNPNIELGSENELTAGIYRGNTYKLFKDNISEDARAPLVIALGLVTGIIPMLLVSWWVKNRNVDLMITANGIGMNTGKWFGKAEDHIKAFFNAWDTKYPGDKTMFITIGEKVDISYLEKMVKEAKERGITLKLSPECEKDLRAKLGDKAEAHITQVKALFQYEVKKEAVPVGNAPQLVSGDAAAQTEKSDFTPSTPRTP